jgi:hypothetical protein
LRNLLNIVLDSNCYSKDSYYIYFINSSCFIKNYLARKQAFEVSCNNKNKTSLYNKVDLQKKLLLSILNTIKRLERKSRIFKYLAKEHKTCYNKLDNLLQYIRNLNNNKYKYITNKRKSKFCNKCNKILSRQCNYTCYIYSKHLDINLNA